MVSLVMIFGGGNWESLTMRQRVKMGRRVNRRDDNSIVEKLCYRSIVVQEFMVFRGAADMLST